MVLFWGGLGWGLQVGLGGKGRYRDDTEQSSPNVLLRLKEMSFSKCGLGYIFSSNIVLTALL